MTGVIGLIESFPDLLFLFALHFFHAASSFIHFPHFLPSPLLSSSLLREINPLSPPMCLYFAIILPSTFRLSSFRSHIITPFYFISSIDSFFFCLLAFIPLILLEQTFLCLTQGNELTSDNYSIRQHIRRNFAKTYKIYHCIAYKQRQGQLETDTYY